MTEDYKEILVKEAAALSKEYNVMAIMCCGSQNYGLDTEASDFDTKAVVVPSFEDLVKGNQVSKTVTFVCGICDVKDVRLYIDNLKKQNVNYVETLFTEHILVNPRYKDVFDILLGMREKIAVIDKERALNAMYGMLVQEDEKLRKSCVAGEKEAANKHYVNVFKCALMADKYMKYTSYDEVLDCSKIKALRYKDLPLAEVQAHAERLKAKTKESVDHFLASEIIMPDTDTADWLDTWILEFLKAELITTASPAPTAPQEKQPAVQDTEEAAEDKTTDKPKKLFGRRKKGSH